MDPTTGVLWSRLGTFLSFAEVAHGFCRLRNTSKCEGKAVPVFMQTGSASLAPLEIFLRPREIFTGLKTHVPVTWKDAFVSLNNRNCLSEARRIYTWPLWHTNIEPHLSCMEAIMNWPTDLLVYGYRGPTNNLLIHHHSHCMSNTVWITALSLWCQFLWRKHQ